MYLVTNMSNVPTAYRSTRNEVYIMKEKAATRLDIITYLKFSLLLFIAFFALFSPHTVNADTQETNETEYVETTPQDIDKLKQYLKTMDKYIDKNTGYFDENLAIDNNEEELILEAGREYNEIRWQESQEMYESINRKKRSIADITRYGNWCGKGNNGRAPIDILDAQCKKHDNCYSSRGMWNTSCDIEFLHNLARNFGAITKRGTHATAYAIAAISGFAYKVGGTAKLKSMYPILIPFIP